MSGKWEVLLVVISIGALNGLMIGVVEGYLVVLSMVLSLGPPLKYPNLRAVVCSWFSFLDGIILGMSLGNSLGYLLEYIWHINWCGTYLGTWQLFWQFNWVPSLLFSWIGTWYTVWNADRSFTWKLSGQVLWGIYRIALVILFASHIEALFDSDYWSYVLQLSVDILPG